MFRDNSKWREQMIADVLMSDAFEQSFSRLPFPMRDIVKRKIRLLSENPGHPSLNSHRLRNVKANIWDCFICEVLPRIRASVVWINQQDQQLRSLLWTSQRNRPLLLLSSKMLDLCPYLRRQCR